MKYFKALSLILLIGVASAQNGYDYPKPTTPRGTYLPPNETEEKVAAEGLSPDGEHEPGMPFDFTYAVKDDTGNDFSHNAESNGDVVKGEYRTLLPDGRTQVVKYTADWKNGYNAEVTYEGEAVFPEPKPTPARPATRPPYETDEQNDSQGLRPSTPGYNYPAPPPPTTRRPPPPPPTRPPPPPPTTRRPAPPPTRPPPPPQTTRRAPPPPQATQGSDGYNYPAPTTRAPPPPRVTQPPPPPPGLYGAPSVPFGVRNNPKFGYSK